MDIRQKAKQLRMVLSLRDNYFIKNARFDKGDGKEVTPKSMLPMFDDVISELLGEIDFLSKN